MTQVWIRDDPLDYGSLQYNTVVAGYIGLEPASTGYTKGLLCDFDSDNQPSATSTDGTKTTEHCAFMHCQYEVQDVTVELSTSLQGVNGLQGIAQFSQFYGRTGVLAKIKDRSLIDFGTVNVRWTGISAYGFECTGTGFDLSFQIVRYKAGTRTVLGTLNAPTSLNFNVRAPMGLRLEIADVAGFPFLSGTITNIEVSGQLLQEYPVFVAVPDTSGDRITGTGRVGFIVGQDRTEEPLPGFVTTTRTKTQYFTAYPVGGDLDDGGFRDEWERQAPANAYQVTNDFGQTAACVQSWYAGDQYDATGNDNLEFVGGATPIINGSSTSTSKRRVFMSQRPPDDVNSQTPLVRAEFVTTFTNGSNASAQFGVVARGTSDILGNNLTGYVATILRDIAGTLMGVRLYRFNGGFGTLLASRVGIFDLASTFVSRPRIQLEVAQANGTPNPSDPVQLRVFATDDTDPLVVQPLTAQAVPGVTAVGDYIIDSSTDRIYSGGEGIFFDTVNTINGIGIFEWEQGTIVNGSQAPQDIPSVAFSGEGTASASLNDYARIVLPVATRAQTPALATRMDSGHLWTRAQEATSRRIWQGVQTEPMTETERDAFLGFWRSHAVPGAAFNFTDKILETTYKVRAVEASLDEDRLFKDAHVFRFDMEELR